MVRSCDVSFNHEGVITRELPQSHLFVLETGVVDRHQETIPLLLLVADTVLFDEDALRQVLQQEQLKVVKLVIDVLADTLVSEVSVDLGSALKGVAVLVHKSVESVNLVLASSFNLLEKNFAITLKIISATSDTLQQLMAVGKSLKLVNGRSILTDDSVNVVVLDVDFALQQLNASADEVLKTANNRIAANGGLYELKVVSSSLRISIGEALTVQSDIA